MDNCENKINLIEREKAHLEAAKEAGRSFLRYLIAGHTGGLVISMNVFLGADNDSLSEVSAEAFKIFVIGVGISMLCAFVGHANTLFRSLYPSDRYLNNKFLYIAYYGLDALTGLLIAGGAVLFFSALFLVFKFATYEI